MKWRNLLSLTLLGLLPGLALAGGSSVWPGPAPCNTTLQACVDATTNGNTVLIDTDTPIAEDLNLYNRSLSIVPAYGRRPNFASGRWIAISSAPILGDQTVTLRGIRVNNSYVRATYNGTGTARYDLRGLILSQTTAGLPTYIQVEANSGTLEAMLYDNQIDAVPRNLNAGLIELVNRGATLNASAFYNRISSTSAIATDGAGLFVDVTGNGAGTIKAHANTVRGGYYRGSIFVSEGLFSSTSSSFNARIYSNVVVCADNTLGGGTSGTGISFTANNGSISAQAINNTLTRCYYGISANQWSGGGASAAISGTVSNNLIVGDRGLAFTAALTPSLNNDYNLLNVNVNFATLGVHTITAPAQLVADTAPRLRPGSPAIDAADTALLGLGIIFNALPQTDADGLRRLKGSSSGSDGDIGAYEFGDLSVLHRVTAANTTTGSYISRIENPALDGQAALSPQATPNWNASGVGVSNNSSFGIYYFNNFWRVFNEDTTTPMPLGAAFNLFAPAAGSGVFRHVSTAANSAGFTTRLENDSVDNRPGQIVLATQNWSAGSGIYNPHPIGVFYFAFGGPGNWFISNLDQVTGGDVPLNAGFDIYAQEASPSAFRVNSSLTGSVNTIVLDHPLLNDRPCALVHAARVYDSTSVPQHFDVYYGSGRWRIFSYSVMNPGTQFNVVVDPAQVFDCSDRIFANGFQ